MPYPAGLGRNFARGLDWLPGLAFVRLALAWKRWALQARTQVSCRIDLKRGKKSSTKLV